MDECDDLSALVRHRPARLGIDMKKIGIALLLVLAGSAGALYWLSGNMNSLVKDAIEKYGSAMTRATVKVAAVEIRPGDGRGVIRGLIIGNPAGFKTVHAMEVGEIEIAIDIASVTREVVTIRKIAILAPDIVYEKGETMTNFDVLQKNIADYVGPTGKPDSDGKKLIVGELSVRNAKIQVSAGFLKSRTVAMSLPDIGLHNLGKARDGVSPGELGQEIVTALRQKLMATVSFDHLKTSAEQHLDKAGSAIKGWFGR